MNRATDTRLRKLEQDSRPGRQICVFVVDDEDAAPRIAARNPGPRDDVIVFRTIYEKRAKAPHWQALGL